MKVLKFMVGVLCLTLSQVLLIESKASPAKQQCIAKNEIDNLAFYCEHTSPPGCIDIEHRCTGSDQCINPNNTGDEEGCGKSLNSEEYEIYNNWSRFRRGLFSWLKSIFKCIFYYKKSHQFVQYRGLVYEYGGYGLQVLDINDPKYKYDIYSYKVKSTNLAGYSTCTHEDIYVYNRWWRGLGKYRLCSHNCQDYAEGLMKYLKKDCKGVPKRAKRSTVNNDVYEDYPSYFDMSYMYNGSVYDIYDAYNESIHEVDNSLSIYDEYFLSLCCDYSVAATGGAKKTTFASFYSIFGLILGYYILNF